MRQVQLLESDHLHHDMDFLRLKNLLLARYYVEAEKKMEEQLKGHLDAYQTISDTHFTVQEELDSGFPPPGGFVQVLDTSHMCGEHEP